MGKHQTVYRGYSKTDLKSRASIPLPADITEVTAGTDYIDCNNISLARVKNFLGEPYYSVPSVCTSNKVNVWSGFGPVWRYVTGTPALLTNRFRTAGEGRYLADFAGYNHRAIPPAYYTSGLGVIKIYPDLAQQDWQISIDIGEVRYTDGDIHGISDTVRCIGISLWSDDGNLLFQRKGSNDCPMAEVLSIESGSSLQSRVIFGEAAGGYRLRVASGNYMFKMGQYGYPYWDANVETRIELLDVQADGAASNPEIASRYDPAKVICRIPGLAAFNTFLWKQKGNTYSIRGNMSTLVTDPPAYQAGPVFGSGGNLYPTINWTTVEISSNDLVAFKTKGTSVVIRAWVEYAYDNTHTPITDVYVLRSAAVGAYTSGDHLIQETAVDWDDPGSVDPNQYYLKRTIWTLNGVSKGTVDAYDLVLVIDFAGN